MNREDQHSPPPEQDEPRAPAQADGKRDTDNLIADIRRLGHRLLTFDALNDPQVQAALHQLDRQVGNAFAPGRGRHRHRPIGPDVLTRPASVPDALGYDLKPNPLLATTSAEYVQALRNYRAWAGNVPYRLIAARAHQAVAHNTVWVALNSTELPALKVAVAIIIGCGGSSQDQERFVTAWRRINSGNQGPSELKIV
jgi:hypothetical protein